MRTVSDTIKPGLPKAKTPLQVPGLKLGPMEPMHPRRIVGRDSATWASPYGDTSMMTPKEIAELHLMRMRGEDPTDFLIPMLELAMAAGRQPMPVPTPDSPATKPGGVAQSLALADRLMANPTPTPVGHDGLLWGTEPQGGGMPGGNMNPTGPVNDMPTQQTGPGIGMPGGNVGGGLGHDLPPRPGGRPAAGQPPGMPGGNMGGALGRDLPRPGQRPFGQPHGPGIDKPGDKRQHLTHLPWGGLPSWTPDTVGHDAVGMGDVHEADKPLGQHAARPPRLDPSVLAFLRALTMPPPPTPTPTTIGHDAIGQYHRDSTVGYDVGPGPMALLPQSGLIDRGGAGPRWGGPRPGGNNPQTIGHDGPPNSYQGPGPYGGGNQGGGGFGFSGGGQGGMPPFQPPQTAWNLGGQFLPWLNSYPGQFTAPMSQTQLQGLGGYQQMLQQLSGMMPYTGAGGGEATPGFSTSGSPWLNATQGGAQKLKDIQDAQAQRQIASSMAAGGLALSGARSEAAQRYQNASDAAFQQNIGQLRTQDWENQQGLNAQMANAAMAANAQLGAASRYAAPGLASANNALRSMQLGGWQNLFNMGAYPQQLAQQNLNSQYSDWLRQMQGFNQAYMQPQQNMMNMMRIGYPGYQQPQYGPSQAEGWAALLTSLFGGGGGGGGGLGNLLGSTGSNGQGGSGLLGGLGNLINSIFNPNGSGNYPSPDYGYPDPSGQNSWYSYNGQNPLDWYSQQNTQNPSDWWMYNYNNPNYQGP
jgi:hypothetical protein